MKLYRVHARDDEGLSLGFVFHTSKRRAEQEARADLEPGQEAREVESFDFKLTKAGVLKLLTHWASHPDNG